MVGQATNRKDLLKSSGNTADIISAILYADSQSAPYTKELATQLRKPTVLDTCRAIYDFVKQNIEYKEDPDGFQFVQSPGHLYWGDKSKGKGQGDCKSMSVFCGSILQNLGIKYAFRFVSQDRSKDLHHVFIVVPDETSSTICLDCVDDYFNAHYHFSKVKDVVPQHLQAVSKIGAKVGDLKLYNTVKKSATGVIKQFGKDYDNWNEYLRDYVTYMPMNYNIEKSKLLKAVENDWNSVKAMAVFEPISMLLLGAKGQKKVTGYFEDTLDKAAFHQLLYYYWDDMEAAFPVSLKNKRDQAKLFLEGMLHTKINTRITAGFPDKNKGPYLSYYSLMVFADWHCFITYGYPLDILLRKAYNFVNMGSDAIPIAGWPYYNLKQGQWIANGADAVAMSKLDYCLPYTGGNFYPVGVPYWCKGGFIMPNGATPENLKLYKENNPIPNGLVPVEDRLMTVNLPGGGSYQMPSLDYLFLVTWFEDGVINNKFSITGQTITAADNGRNDPNVQLIPWINKSTSDRPGATIQGPKIGIAPAVIATVVTAVVTVVVSLLSLLAKLLDKQKSEAQIKQDMTNYPIDFKNSYTTADGCFMEATNVNGQIVYNKKCPDGSVTPNANPNAPENIPANGATGLLGNLKSAWPLMLATVAIGFLLIFSSSSKKSKA